ncbi:hypothetical protein MM213_07900 [Belliella sp. R4-6]|uniref:Uncharacterized protein n=1 Tax=Belliella alkalica TaxID=1730871 RepID=A0ABS9VAE6_9BACT|nr:hypothetical protein [Belliella alkalica]MCH7413402.1 hypothetical protein [Belliella alkalica]
MRNKSLFLFGLFLSSYFIFGNIDYVVGQDSVEPIYESCYGNQNEVGHHTYVVLTKFCGSGQWGQGEVSWEDCEPILQSCCPMMDFEPEPKCTY